MATMLDLAEKRNPNQPLDTPFKLGDTPVETIGAGVEAFRDQERVNAELRSKIVKAETEISNLRTMIQEQSETLALLMDG